MKIYLFAGNLDISFKMQLKHLKKALRIVEDRCTNMYCGLRFVVMFNEVEVSQLEKHANRLPIVS